MEYELAEVLRDFARTMVTDFPIEAILDHLVRQIVEIMPVTAAGVTLIGPDVRPRYISASNDAALRFEELQSELGEGPCLVAYHSGEAVAVPALRSEERFPRFRGRALAEGIAAVFTFPLHEGDRRLGALDLYRDLPGPLSDEAMTAAQILADVASAYLINAQARAELQDSSDRSRHAALHDALTGLPNRVLLAERLEHALIRAPRSGKAVAVLYMDLDGFKAVNDTYGHHVGDQLLIAVAKRITRLLRPSDTVTRIGGDEFVILCEDIEVRAHAERIVDRVHASLAWPFVLSDTEVSVAASIGVAFAGGMGVSAHELLRDADAAMYAMKRNRGDRRVLDLRDANLTDHLSSPVGDLAGALDRGELHLDYQPVVATVDGHVSGVVAMLRWTHPARGPISPSLVMRLAETSGMGAQIGRWMLEQAWTERSRWSAVTPAGQPRIAVQISVTQFLAHGFIETVAEVLGADDSPPQLLVLEVTEDVIGRDYDRALNIFERLRGMGVTIALDNFGTGPSSLHHLSRFPVDIIKIDRTFVHNLRRYPATITVLAAIIQLAHRLDIAVTANAVDTAAQHHELSTLGCDACQGNYYAPPMAATDLHALLDHVRTQGEVRTRPGP